MTSNGLKSWVLALLLTCSGGTLFAQGWVITGTVTDAVGSPIAGVDLDLVNPLQPGTIILISGDTTLLDGSFNLVVLDAIPAGSYSLQVEPPPGFMGTTLSISLSGNLDVGTIPLGSGWIISGTVVDTSGNPLTPIDIDMRGSNTGWLDLTGDFTNALGNFAVTLPALVDEYRIDFAMNSLVPTVFPLSLDDVFLFGDTDLGFIVMEPGFNLTGSVVDQNEDPLPGIDMNAADALGNLADLFNDDSDINGQFSVLFPQGTWEVSLRSVDPLATVNWIPFSYGQVVVTESVNLPLAQMLPGYHVLGTVVDSLGVPIEGANIDAEFSTSGIPIDVSDDTTGLTGTFDVLLPEGTLQVEINPPATGPTRQTALLGLTVTPGPATDLGQIVLPDGVLLSGRCVDTSGLPVPLVDVEILDPTTGTPYPTVHENADVAGNFSFATDPGIYDLLLVASSNSGLSPHFQSGVVLTSDLDLGDIVMQPGFSLSGIVTVNGILADNIEITATDSVTGVIPPWGAFTTGPLGEYQVSLAGGNYDLLFRAPAGSNTADYLLQNYLLDTDTIMNVNLLPPLPQPVSNLTCLTVSSSVELTWTNQDLDYDSIVIERDGVLLQVLSGSETLFLDNSPLVGIAATYEVIARRSGLDSPGTTCIISAPFTFLRCDSDGDGSLTIADAIRKLDYLFSQVPLSCLDAGDCNDSGTINIADPVMLLQHLFVTGAPPPEPFPDAGVDPTPDALECP